MVDIQNTLHSLIIRYNIVYNAFHRVISKHYSLFYYMMILLLLFCLFEVHYE